MLPNRLKDHEILKQAFKQDLKRRLPEIVQKTPKLASVYFGGGTPSLFSGAGEILKLLPEAEEITIEANPEQATLSLFTHLREQGFNRLSLGVQSLDDRSLQTLERTHSAREAKKAILLAKEAGFSNISIDLMYDLPDQTLSSWQYTLDKLEELPIQHLSLYNLTIEPHTAFHKRKLKQPGGELSLQFLQAALRKLDRLGLKRYEISAFAKPGYESRHNLGYWTARPFFGIGPSAFSYWEGARFRNINHLQKYAKALEENSATDDFYEKLEPEFAQRELLAVRLRLMEGVLLSDFSLSQSTLDSIDKLKKEGFIHGEKRLFLTEKGTLFYDSVASELV